MATVQAKLVLEWSQEDSVGVMVLDSEHEKFFQLTQKLYDAIRIGSSRGVIGALLGELYAYSVSHMTHEEDILELHSFPELEAHRAEHKHFRKKVREYMDEFDAGRTAIALSLLKFLQEWFKTHIHETDQRYVQFLKEKGVR